MGAWPGLSVPLHCDRFSSGSSFQQSGPVLNVPTSGFSQASQAGWIRIPAVAPLVAQHPSLQRLPTSCPVQPPSAQHLAVALERQTGLTGGCMSFAF